MIYISSYITSRNTVYCINVSFTWNRQKLNFSNDIIILPKLQKKKKKKKKTKRKKSICDGWELYLFTFMQTRVIYTPLIY